MAGDTLSGAQAKIADQGPELLSDFSAMWPNGFIGTFKILRLTFLFLLHT